MGGSTHVDWGGAHGGKQHRTTYLARCPADALRRACTCLRTPRQAASAYMDQVPDGLPAYAPVARTRLQTSSRRSSVISAATASSSRGPVEHCFSLYDSKNVPWATLRLQSHSSSARFLPSYFEGQPINGRVDFNLSKPETIHGVSIIVNNSLSLTADCLDISFQFISSRAPSSRPTAILFLSGRLRRIYGPQIVEIPATRHHQVRSSIRANCRAPTPGPSH